MNKRAGRMPWLDLLTEEKLYLCRVFFRKAREYRFVEGVEHFGRKRADVVEVKLDGVNGLWRDIGGEGLARKFGSECHPGKELLGY